MKNNNLFQLITFLAVALFTFSFISCSKDDDNENDGGAGNGTNSFVGTWRKYKSISDTEISDQLGHILWVFNDDETMYEHDIDDDLNIIEGHTETFRYKTENGHLYTDKLRKEGYKNEWKDEGSYVISNDILELTKNSGNKKRYKKIK